MRIAVDACSVILLAKATVLEELAKWRELMITNSVYKEVLEGKEKSFLDALLLERLVNEKKIAVCNEVKEVLTQKLKIDFGLGAGEAESITLALENTNRMILTDNKQGRKTAKIQGLKLLGSIDTVLALFKAKRITKEKAIGALKTLKEMGWFQEYLIETALEEVNNG